MSNDNRPQHMRRNERSMGMMLGSEKARDFKGTLKKLLQYLSKFRLSIVIVMIFAIASTVFSILSPRLLGNITNQIVDDYTKLVIYDQVVKNLPQGVTLPEGATGADVINMMPQEMVSKIPADRLETFKTMDLSKKPTISFDLVGKTVILLIILYVLSMAFGYLQGWIITGVAQKITYKFRKDIIAKISKLPFSYFDKQTHGEVLSRVTNDVDTVSQNFNQGVSQIVSAVTSIIGVLVMMLTISWLLTLVAVILLPISFGFIAIISKKSQKLFKRQQDSLGEINGYYYY